MALDLGTVISAVEAVNKAIEIYKRVQDLPQQMDLLGKRMERQNIVLLQVESFVKKYAHGVDPILAAGQRADLMRIIGNVKENADKVTELFERVEKDILSRSLELQFRNKLAARLWFALVEKQPDKIQAIMDEIKHDRKELSDYVGIINAEIGAQILLKAKQTEQREREKNKDKNQKPGAVVTGNPAKALSPPIIKRRPSPSPSPLPAHRDYKILFVDPQNQARSVVAEALLLLLGGLTTLAASKLSPNNSTTTKPPWRISQVHSAGFQVKHKSDLSTTLAALPYSHPSYRLPLVPGNDPPNAVALSAVFGNTSYDYPFKARIQSQITSHRSVGLTRDVFNVYDYIVVFTNREHDNMVRLREALIREGASSRHGGGKGRVLHLGMYVAQRNGAPKEIVAVLPRKDDKKTTGTVEKGGDERREDWNGKVAQIKTALKGFLREEMKWERPDEEALKKVLGDEKGKGGGKEDKGKGVAGGGKGKEPVSAKGKGNSPSNNKGKVADGKK